MATNRISITDLDFDQIKNNLKEFLKSQSEFQDYDFEGSGLNILLDVLAYNTHYQSYYLNMVANESFLDTAILRDSVVSHAKTLGYIPFSATASRATINFTINLIPNSTQEIVTFPRGTTFRSDVIDNKLYNFVLLEDTTSTKANNQFIFENLDIYEGNLVSYRYVYDSSTNPKSIFTLPETNVDTKTLKVSVQQSVSNTDSQVYTQNIDVLNVDETSTVYFLQEGRNLQYQIYFGDNVIGKKLQDGNVVIVEYLVTNGNIANKSVGFTLTENISNFVSESDFHTIDMILASNGGSARESVDEIKTKAPLQYSSQNRLVTITDYSTYLKKVYPTIDSISVWGGEDQIPKIYGKIFLSIKPKEGYYLSEIEKQRIIDEIVKPKSMVSVTTEIRDPEYLYLLFNNSVRYNARKTNLSPNALKTKIRNSILSHKNAYLNQFNSVLYISRLQDDIDNSDNSIIGNDVEHLVQKRFTPVLNSPITYNISFGTALKRGTDFLNKLISTEFNVFDSSNVLRTVTLEEVPQSYTGISSIEIINPGFGYTSVPTVTITGDGFNAAAVAKIVNGKIESIEITNRGYDYSKAVVTITGGGGLDAAATPSIDAKIGTLRTIYFDSIAQRQIVDSNAGEIYYDEGLIILKDLNVSSVNSTDGQIRLTAEAFYGIIESSKNIILTLDENDESAINILLEQK